MQRVALQVVHMKARGWPSHVCALGTHPSEPGLWGPGVPPQAATVALLIHVHTSTCNFSFSLSCSSQGGLGLLVWGQFCTAWPERAPLSPHLCQPVPLWQVAFALLAQTGRVKKLEALKKQERLAAGRY